MASGAAPARRGGSDDPPHARPADRRRAALRASRRSTSRSRSSGSSAGSASTSSCTSRACPYLETIRKEARARGPLQEADGRARPVRRLPDHRRAARGARGLRVRRQDRRRRHPAELPPRGRQGHPGGDAARRARRRAGAGRPRLARRRLVPQRRLLGDGVQDRRLDGVQEAYEQADPVLLEPIMEVEVTVPDEAVGAVNGDLNSRRGRLQGMEPRGGMTTIKAEVPMAEILTYSQSLTSLTGGRGDYAMHFVALRGSARAHRAEGDHRDEEGARGGQGVGAPRVAALGRPRRVASLALCVRRRIRSRRSACRRTSRRSSRRSRARIRATRSSSTAGRTPAAYVVPPRQARPHDQRSRPERRRPRRGGHAEERRSSSTRTASRS